MFKGEEWENLMDDMTVVCFGVAPEEAGRIRRRDSWRYHVEYSVPVLQPAAVNLARVRLPGCSRKKKGWTVAGFREYWKGIPVPGEGRGVYYVYSPEAAAFLNRETEPLPFEWVLFLIEYYGLAFDALVLLEDRELEAAELVRRYARNTRYLGVAAADPGLWEDTIEQLSEEYGFLLDVASGVKELHVPSGGKTLYIAGRELYGATPACLPPGSVWLSTDTAGAAGRNVCAGAREARYINGMRLFRKWFL